MLGVHANTVRTWTDQGVLTCLRINRRGDRRYARQEIARFLAHTDSAAPAQSGSPSNGLLTRSAALAVRKADAGSAVEAIVELLGKEKGYSGAALIALDGSARTVFGTIDADTR